MKYILVCCLLSCSVVLKAQNIFNSPYSVYGLGIMNERLSTLNRGMAGTGIAVRDEYNLSYVNPASYGSIQPPLSSIYEMGFYLESNKLKNKALSESKTNGSLTNLNFWFKLRPKWSSTIGLSPFSSVSYNINTTRNLGSGTDVNYTYNGSGTISRFYWGNSFNVTKNLSVGANFSFLFGSISKSEFITTPGGTGSLTFENKISPRKFGVDVGMQYAFSLKKNRSFVVGLIADPGVKFNASQKNYLYNESADTLNTSVDSKRQYKVPASAGIGLALQTSRSILASDIRFQHWSDIKSSDPETTFQDTWKFSAGYMYKGNPNATNYVGGISLRAGFFAQTYYQVINKNVLPWWGMTMGLSMPMFDNRSSINFTYSFEKLGTLNQGLILQQSQQIMVDVIIRDIWGIKRKFD